MSPSARIILVAGPTASGKSRFAQDLAPSCNGEILNADSQQFYRGLDIGTGKLPPHEQKVRHWLLDVCPPGGFMTAMDFARLADDRIAQLNREGKTPIVVGGTGLYLRALLEGLDPLPPRNPELRKKIQGEWAREGGEHLHERLRKIDPAAAVKISSQDPSRLIRYLEIHALTGKPPSSLMRRGRSGVLRYAVHSYWLSPTREELRERIQRRVQTMIEAGWLEEVRELLDSGQDPRGWENKPIGYADLAACVSGEISLEETVAKIVLKTRQYAKRQETFFRGLFKNPAYQNNGCRLSVVNGVGA
jgi:tRNA dimethylallyltransferase